MDQYTPHLTQQQKRTLLKTPKKTKLKHTSVMITKTTRSLHIVKLSEDLKYD